MEATDSPEVQNSYQMGPEVGLGATTPGSYGPPMDATTAPEPTTQPVDRPRRAAAARLLVATAASTTTLVALAEVAHARIALNHNETAGRDRR